MHRGSARTPSHSTGLRSARASSTSLRPQLRRIGGGGLFGIEDSFAKSGITVVDPCVVATVEHFRTHVLTHKPALLTILAHGDRLGGAIYFHSGDSPSDAAPLDGSELANLLRRAGTRVALLWSCQAARPHQRGGAVADVEQPELFDRILPYHGEVYWASDRL